MSQPCLSPVSAEMTQPMKEAGDSDIEEAAALKFSQAAAPVGSAGWASTLDQDIEQTRKRVSLLELRRREAELTAGLAQSKTARSSGISNVVRESLASSSAHGISRAAATDNIPLRVAWILLFLFFLGLFCHSAVTHIYKLANVNAVTTIQMDKVPFEIPDVYVCPRNAISGSYPYSLNESEAAMVNDEVERLGKLFDELAARPEWQTRLKDLKFYYILRSLHPEVMKLLIWRSEQSLWTGRNVKEKIFLSEDHHCAKLDVHLYGRASGGYTIVDQTILFTDPYNPHLNHTGVSVKPIAQNNVTLELPQWYFSSVNGFALLFMPKGAMPDFDSGSLLLLAPGQSYEIKLSMEKVVFSEEFHGKNCSPSEPNLVFLDRLSGAKLEYNFSFVACCIEKVNRHMFANSMGVNSRGPIPWDLRNSPQLGTIDYKMRFGNKKNVIVLPYDDILSNCRQREPCEYPRYTASYSTLKWPEFNGKYSWLFHNTNSNIRTPAIDQLSRIAKQLDACNRTAEDRLQEIEFRQFLASSLLQFRVETVSDRSPLLTIEPSYSWTAFMSDIGGLLGVYIGCSLLTVCELLEQLFHVVSHAVTRRTSGRPEGPGDDGLPAAMPDEAAMDEQLTEGV